MRGLDKSALWGGRQGAGRGQQPQATQAGTPRHLDTQSQILGDRDTQIEKHSHTGTDTLLHQDTQAYLDTQTWTHSQVRPRIKKTHTSSDTDLGMWTHRQRKIQLMNLDTHTWNQRHTCT